MNKKLPSIFTNKALKKELGKIKTPFIVFDLEKVVSNYQEIKSLLKSAQVFYAVKANKLKPILTELNNAGCGFEVNTKAEFDAVISTGHDPKKLINSAPIKRVEDIEYMYKKGVKQFAFDSKDEIEKLKKHAPKSKVYLRFHTSNHGSGQELNTKSGVLFKEASYLLDEAKRAKLEPFALTFTVGSQCNNIKNWKEGIEKAAVLFKKFKTLNTVNLGGGIPIEYEEKSLSPKVISKEINKLLNEQFEKRPNVYIEPGRYLTGSCGTLVTSIIGVKENGRGNWIYIDASIFGTFIELFEFDHKTLSYPVLTEKKGNKITYNIAGPTCDGCDIIKRNVELPRIERNDRLMFLNVGAYTLEYGSDFNGYPKPEPIYLKNRKLFKF